MGWPRHDRRQEFQALASLTSVFASSMFGEAIPLAVIEVVDTFLHAGRDARDTTASKARTHQSTGQDAADGAIRQCCSGATASKTRSPARLAARAARPQTLPASADTRWVALRNILTPARRIRPEGHDPPLVGTDWLTIVGYKRPRREEARGNAEGHEKAAVAAVAHAYSLPESVPPNTCMVVTTQQSARPYSRTRITTGSFATVQVLPPYWV